MDVQDIASRLPTNGSDLVCQSSPHNLPDDLNHLSVRDAPLISYATHCAILSALGRTSALAILFA